MIRRATRWPSPAMASSSAVTDKQHETPQAMINWIAAYVPKKAKS